MTTEQPEASLKTFYATYEREGEQTPVVRLVEAENIDAAWDVAETLEADPVSVDDIPPTGNVQFLDESAVPFAWKQQPSNSDRG